MDKSAFEALGFLPVILGGLSFFLSVPTIVALCTARAVAKGLRMYLLNILMSEILINASAILTGLIALVTVFSAAPAPPSLLCRFIIWVVNISQLARCFSVVGFSLMVLIVVWYGYKKNQNYVHHCILECCLGCIHTSYHPVSSTPGVCSRVFIISWCSLFPS